MKNNKRTRAGSEAQYGPRLAGKILHDYLENSNEPLAVAYRERHDETDGWHKNTELCVNMKTLLRSDVRMKVGKDYQGVLRLDSEGVVEEYLSRDPHYTFTETLPLSAGKRNPRVFKGEFITITRQDNGTYRPNFRPMKVGADFSVEKYAAGVANELLWALEGLIESGSVEEESE